MFPHSTSQQTHAHHPAGPSSLPTSPAGSLPNAPRPTPNSFVEIQANHMVTPQGVPHFSDPAQYQQYIASLLNNNNALKLPIVPPANQVPAPGHSGSLPSVKGSFVPPPTPTPAHHPYHQHPNVQAIYQRVEHQFRRAYEEQWNNLQKECGKLKEDMKKLKKDCAMNRREAEAYKKLYEDLKTESSADLGIVNIPIEKPAKNTPKAK